MKSANVRASDV